MREGQLGAVADLITAGDDVHVQRPRAPAHGAHAPGRRFRGGAQAQHVARRQRGHGEQHGVQVVGLLGPADGGGLEHSRDRCAEETASHKHVDAELEVSHPVAQIAAERQHHGALAGQPRPGVRLVAAAVPGHGWLRRIVTAMSSNWCPSGACGLCTVTSASRTS